MLSVKEECVSEDEEEVKDTLVEEILQQGDTAIIFPEAPEDEQSPAETGGADENGNIYGTKHHCSAFLLRTFILYPSLLHTGI